MLAFLRINDPLRIVFVLIALLALRLPLLFAGIDLMRPELYWMLVGERMADGKALYTEVWADSPPLAAGVYWALHLLFGRSQAAYQGISIALIIFQAFVFNRTLIRYDVYKERTYVPAATYVFFCCCCLEFCTLPPVLMAQTFLILVLRNVFHWDEQAPDPELFRTGLFLGIATLLYIPAVLFLLMTLLGLALFRTSSARKLLLILYGFGFVLALYLIYQWFSGGAPQFWSFSVGNTFFDRAAPFTDWQGLATLFSLPAFILLISVLRTFREHGFVTYQTSCQQVMVIWLTVSLLAIAVSSDFAAFQAYSLAPVWSFFVAHYVLLIKRRFRAELTFLLILACTMVGSYAPAFIRTPRLSEAIRHDKLFVQAPDSFPLEGRDVLALSDDIAYYAQNHPVTPYLDWSLTKARFARIDQYETLLAIRRDLMAESPQVIADPDRILPELLVKLPDLGELYHPSSDSSYYYTVGQQTARR